MRRIYRNSYNVRKFIFYAIASASLIFFLANSYASSGNDFPLEKAHINLKDKKSLQRGAKLYINYCLGCHSMHYMRYNSMAKDIGLVNQEGEIYNKLIKENLILSDAKVVDPIKTSMDSGNAKQWFGVVPPDLTLITRIRGVDWVYTYLRSFYKDEKRPWGVNNALFPDVAMPNVLAHLQGIQIPKYTEIEKSYNGVTQKVKVIKHLILSEQGEMSPVQFDGEIRDIVNFLAYTAEPVKLQRERIGIWVLLFLVLFSVVAYFLKKEFWSELK